MFIKKIIELNSFQLHEYQKHIKNLQQKIENQNPIDINTNTNNTTWFPFNDSGISDNIELWNLQKGQKRTNEDIFTSNLNQDISMCLEEENRKYNLLI